MDAPASEFSFLFGDLDKSPDLQQGDLLRRTERLKSILAKYHSYYAEEETYTHFLVLTQSCDLVRRKGKAIKAPYITICAVRPAQILVDRRMADAIRSEPIRVGRTSLQIRTRQLIERLSQNTEEGVFFFDTDTSRTINEPMCAFLQLSVSLKTEHYEALQSARVATLADIFAAKLGWLVGNLYSRVGTPDPASELGETTAKSIVRRLESELLQDMRWLRDQDFDEYIKAIDTRKSKGEEITAEWAADLANSFLPPKERAARAAVDALVRRNLLTPEDAGKAVNFVLNYAAFSGCFRNEGN